MPASCAAAWGSVVRSGAGAWAVVGRRGGEVRQARCSAGGLAQGSSGAGQRTSRRLALAQRRSAGGRRRNGGDGQHPPRVPHSPRPLPALALRCLLARRDGLPPSWGGVPSRCRLRRGSIQNNLSSPHIGPGPTQGSLDGGQERPPLLQRPVQGSSGLSKARAGAKVGEAAATSEGAMRPPGGRRGQYLRPRWRRTCRPAALRRQAQAQLPAA